MNISVLMSVYYKENPEFLRQAVDSIITQTFMPEQIVLVKDGILTDELDELIDNFRKEYPDLFTIVPLTENAGLDAGMQSCRKGVIHLLG